MKSFKETYELQKRKDIYEKESKQHPNKVGVIAEMHPKSKLSITRYFKYVLRHVDSWRIAITPSDPSRKPSRRNSSGPIKSPRTKPPPSTSSRSRNCSKLPMVDLPLVSA